MTDTDLLAPSRDRHVIDGAALAAALRRKREAILALAIIGALAGALLTLALPAAKSATTLVYLRFPDGTDPTQAMPTELAVLKTRTVARSALPALDSKEDPAKLLSKYTGTIVGNGVLRLTATGRDAAIAQRRADAVASAFLAYRAQLAQEQVDATVAALKTQQVRLRQQIAADDAAITAAANNGSAKGSTYTGLLDDRQQHAAEVQQIDATIQSDEVSAQSVAEGSRVIDTAYVTPISTKKTIAKNTLTGVLVGLLLGVGGVLFAAVVTTRLRRRADIAAALRSPVVLNLGRVVPSGWRQLVERKPTIERPNPDLERLVAYLARTLTLTASRALVIVSIDSLDVARLAVLALEVRLRGRGLAVSLVNETNEDLPNSSPVAIGEDEGDIVLVLAVLDPADGAQHLREWGSTAVAIVTAGRSTENTLTTSATMLRSASLDLSAVVLVGSDPSDTTLGIQPHDSAASSGPVEDEERLPSSVEVS